MNNGLLCALQRRKGFADDVLSGLGQYLDSHVVRNQILLNQGTQELILGLRRRREAHLDLLEAYFAEELEKAHLLLQSHGNHQRLVAVTQIHAAPYGSLVYVILLGPLHTGVRR